MRVFEAPLVRVRMGKRVEFAEAPPPEPPPRPRRADAAARALALGYRIVWAVERGEVRDFSHAARIMGVSQPRVSVLVGMTFLAPGVQELLLFGRRNAYRPIKVVLGKARVGD